MEKAKEKLKKLEFFVGNTPVVRFNCLIDDKKISILSRGLKQDLVLNTKINDENKIYKP